MESAIYSGQVYHQRFSPTQHGFNYEMDYLFANIDELDKLFSTSLFWSNESPNLVNFKRDDYLPSSQSLRETVVKVIEDLSGDNFSGQIFLLAKPRCLGHCMNPLALFYCYDDQQVLKYVVAEVHNTPWNERHVYLLEGPDFEKPTQKAFHVSPFMPMDTSYHWQISDPQESLTVTIKVTKNEQALFQASMALKKQVITGKTGTRLAFRQAIQAFKTLSAIYYQALLLWLKRVPFFKHPDSNKPRGASL